MPELTIFILDADHDHAESITNLFINDSFNLRILKSITAIADELSFQLPALCLIAYPTLLEAEREQVIRLFKTLKDGEVVVYNVPEDATKRLAFYDLGARRVYDTSHSLEEIYFSLKWLLRILMGGNSQEIQHSQGKLEDFPVQTLIPLFSREKRSGILKIHSQNSSGKVYFYKGNIIDAKTGTLSGENAFYQLLLWNTGIFTFSSNVQIKPDNHIHISNYGLLLFGKQYLAEFDKLIGKLAPLNNVVRATKVGDLALTDLKIDSRFLSLIKRPHTIQDLLINPHYHAKETIEKLIELKDDGFLIINAPVEHSAEAQESDHSQPVALELPEAVYPVLKENLQITENDEKNIVVFSTEDESRAKFINNLLQDTKTDKLPENLDSVPTRINEQLSLKFIGLAMNENAAETLRKTQDTLAGYIFIIDAKEKSKFEYVNYVINQILAAKLLPSVVAVKGLSSALPLDKIIDLFQTAQPVNWIDGSISASEILLATVLLKNEEEEGEDTEDSVEETAVEGDSK